MSLDHFSAVWDSLIAPARQCSSITPDDIATLPLIPKASYIGRGGNVKLRAIDSSADVTFVNVPSRAILDIRVTAARAAETTASALIGLVLCPASDTATASRAGARFRPMG